MIEIISWSFIFLLSLAILIKSAEYFTDAAEKIGVFLKIPPFIIGVTLVSIGTSLPELVSSVFAVLRGSSEIVVGTVVGANIARIFLVLGLAAVLGKQMKIAYDVVRVDLPLLVGSAFLLAMMAWDGRITFFEGVLCIAGLIVYLFYAVHTEKKREEEGVEAEVKDIQKEIKKEKLGMNIAVTLGITSLFIYFGANYFIMSVVKLSELLHIGKEIMAVSAVALGTTLPELVVTVSMARKGRPEMAVGTVLGSNIFDTFGVVGIPALVGTLAIPSGMLTFGLPVMLAATLLYFFIVQDNEITKWEGWLLIIFYVFFIGELFALF